MTTTLERDNSIEYHLRSGTVSSRSLADMLIRLAHGISWNNRRRRLVALVAVSTAAARAALAKASCLSMSRPWDR